MPSLETVFQGLHNSEIRCGIQNEPPAGGITAWMDFGSRTEKATFYGTIAGTAGWTARPATEPAKSLGRPGRKDRPEKPPKRS